MERWRREMEQGRTGWSEHLPKLDLEVEIVQVDLPCRLMFLFANGSVGFMDEDRLWIVNDDMQRYYESSRNRPPWAESVFRRELETINRKVEENRTASFRAASLAERTLWKWMVVGGAIA